MTITFSAPEQDEQLKPRITVIGVGGAGGNAVNNMISKQLEGVEFVVANTDAQALAQSLAERRVQLGRAITHGLGAGSRPDMGRAAAEEALEDLSQHLGGSHMVFIAAGMGGGTGTGAAPVIARLAREQGMLTVGVVTKPFQFEGTNRMRIADAGIEEMQQFVDTLIVIPNQNLFRIANEKTTFADAFAMADDVLHCGVRGVTDLMVVPGLINLDFADIRSVMSEMGKAMMGTGEAEGDDRARLAAEAAISNPLLDDVSMKGAHGVLINITGGSDMTLFEVDEAANRIGEEVDSDANIIFGSALDPSLDGKIRVSVVATGIDIEAGAQPRPVLRVYGDDSQPRPIPAEARGGHGTVTPPPIPAAATTVPRPAVPVSGAATALALPDFEEPETEEAESGEIDLPDVAPEALSDAPAEASMTMAAERERDMIEADNAADPARREEKPFIPPAPAEAPEAIEDGFGAADPFREAEMLNAAPAPGKEKGRMPGLIKRMTGSGWARREQTARTEPTPAASVRSEPTMTAPAPRARNSAGPAQPETSTQETRPAPKVETPAATPTRKPAENQPRLSGVDPEDRIPKSQSEEDLLDIPAFLRRQAN